MPKAEGPRELPAALLADPEMIRACRTRDFSVVFALVRRRAGIYPSRIAALCGMTPSRVGEILGGQRKLAHIDVIERVVDGLRIPGAMLGLARRPREIPPRATVTEPEPESQPQHTPPSPAAPAADLDGILHLVGTGHVTRSTLVAIQSSIEDYWRRDDQHGGAALRPAVVGHLRYAQQLMDATHEGPLRLGLVALTAELTPSEATPADALRDAKVGPRLARTGGPRDLDRLQALVPAAVAAARGHLDAGRAQWEERISEPLAVQRG
jgi:hypothetical protein